MDHDIGTEDAKYLIFLRGDLMNNLICGSGKSVPTPPTTG